jgi:ribosomal protein S18 acetylase RimI-like enzyme
MTIRNMTIDDYDGVYALWASVPGVGLNQVDDSQRGIKKYLDRNPSTCFVAESGGAVAGVILSGHDGRRGFIYHTAVAPSHRHRGIGTALLTAAMGALKNEGIHKAALVVFADNPAGNSFWENRGFILRRDLLYRNKMTGETEL